MKRIILFLLLLLLSFSFVACNKTPDENDNNKPKEEIVISKYEESYGINDEKTNIKWSYQIPETVTRLKLPDIFGDNMMFQQGKPIRIWGLAPLGEKVEIRLYDEQTGENIAAKGVELVADNSFVCELPAMQASFKSYKLRISMGITQRTYSNILIGEVFLATGQSNMQVTVGETYDGIELLKVANNDKIRAYNPAILPNTGDNTYSYRPQFEIPNGAGNWAKGDDNTIYGMSNVSAVAYSCALQMYQELNKNGAQVPVGFLNLPVGGTSIVTWLPRYATDEDDNMRNALGGSYKAYKEDETMNYGEFTALYNTKIAPVANFNISGMIWYQGCSDEGNPSMYKVAMEKLIECYGKEFRFEQNKMPTVMCHLAPFNTGVYENATTKTAQFNVLFDKTEKNSPDTRAVVAHYDNDLSYCLGDSATIHPRYKETTGRRCGKALYSLTCTENRVNGYDSPAMQTVTEKDGYLLVKFDNCGTGLVAEGAVKGFTIAGVDKVYYSAKAEIVDVDTLKVYSEYVENPKYCAYAYSNLPMKANLKNKEGFMVRPFYSESGKFYCQHDWTDCDYLTAWRYTQKQENGTTIYYGSNEDLYKANGATFELDTTNAFNGNCLKYSATNANSYLAVILSYPYDVHQFNNFTSFSIYVKGDLTVLGVDVVGNETAALSLIGTSQENGYTRYNFSLSNVTVGGMAKSEYNFDTRLQELRINFSGTGNSYIDNMSLGNL